MNMWNAFSQVLAKYAVLFHSAIHIVDHNGIILCSHNDMLLGESFLREPEKYCNTMLKQPIHPDTYLFCTELFEQQNVKYYLINEEKTPNQISVNSEAIKIALSCFLNMPQTETGEEQNLQLINKQQDIIDILLHANIKQAEVQAMLQLYEIDDSRLRIAIVIELDFQSNRYFNININLGYQPVLEKIRSEILETVRSNRYFNTQDIYGFYGTNEIVVLKSFIPTADLTRIYLALDHICNTLLNNLSRFSLLKVKLAYGNIYSDIIMAKESYSEAKQIISIGKVEHFEDDFYSIDTIMIDSICKCLHPHIIYKILIPYIKMLSDGTGEHLYDFLTCSETFVDCCMSFTRASKISSIHRNTYNKRLLKIKELTALDPITNFKDALIIKLINVYIRQNPDFLDVNQMR